MDPAPPSFERAARVTNNLPERSAASAAPHVPLEVLVGAPAMAWLGDASNAESWRALQASCPWSTAFQSPEFYRLWFRHYEKHWSPLLVIARNDAGAPTAVMPLATNKVLITGVGAHQAEYHGWLGAAGGASSFLVAAVAALRSRLPRRLLKLKYTPPGLPWAALDDLRHADPRAIVRRHTRNVIALDATAIRQTLAKSGNRSKHNRLKRQGALECRWLEPREFEERIDDLIAMYDFRQGGLNGICPFEVDEHKREFHLDWLRTLPGQLRTSGLFLDGRMISALIYVVSAKEAHIAIPAHAPEHAANSPNKLHIYESALTLPQQLERIDLTPGDDGWKARSATSTDEVGELTVYPSLSGALFERARTSARRAVQGALARTGISRERVAAMVDKGGDEPSSGEGSTAQFRVFCLPPDHPVAAETSIRVALNPLAILLSDSAATPARQPHLRQTLARMESGGRCFVLLDGASMIGLGWARAKTVEGKATIELSDFSFKTLDLDARVELLSHVVADMKAPRPEVTLNVNGDEALLRAAEMIGFRPL